MGHGFSKISSLKRNDGTESPNQAIVTFQHNNIASNANQISEQLHTVPTISNSSTSSSGSQQIIIRIQLAKMENDNNNISLTSNQNRIDVHAERTAASTSRAVSTILSTGPVLTTSPRTRSSTPSPPRYSFLPSIAEESPPLSSSISLQFDQIPTVAAPAIPRLEERIPITSGSSGYHRLQNFGVAAEYNENLVQRNDVVLRQVMASEETAAEPNSAANDSFKRRSRSKAAASFATNVCRDAFRRILDPSNKNKERKAANKQQEQTHSEEAASTSAAALSAISAVSAAPSSSSVSISNVSALNGDVIIPINPTSNSPQVVVVQCPTTSVVTVGRIDENSLRLTTTQINMNSSAVGASSSGSSNAIAVSSNNVVVASSSNALTASSSSSSSGSSGGIITRLTQHVQDMSLKTSKSAKKDAKKSKSKQVVHSQVDFMHCLVPDLDRITYSSFYWGKIDRYEAERLLDGKPEGTFLLRDSAQEEFLFSVTFRKYGRSLHARIEQSGHQFSFDCHDPCVYTAPTVTGLLEHYKDPSCVMFFEPMLTIPLNRRNAFSLQQLCRATIVSNTTYDGVNELELPLRLKGYLKEYYYKQKLRVKPFDDETLEYASNF